MEKRTLKRRTVSGLVFLVTLIVASIFIFSAVARIRVAIFTDLTFEDLKPGRDYVRLRGAEIHFEQYGDENNKDILLIHGFGGSTLSYKNNIAELSRNHNVFALDLKGYGYSERNLSGSYTLEEQSRIVLDFIKTQGLDDLTAVGHSMGSTVLLLCYEKEPHLFQELVLISSSGLSEAPSFFSGLVSQAIVDVIYFESIVKEERFIAFLSSAFYDNTYVDSTVIDDYRRPFKVKDTNKVLLRIIKDSRGYDIKPVLEKINIPTLIIWGRLDEWVSIEDGYLFNEMIKGSVLEVIDDAGHLPMEEKAEVVNRLLIEFIGRD
jgi:pimeloyl-ACP methyl ester carboxylesterase